MFTRSAAIALAFLAAGLQTAVAQTSERPSVTHQKVKKADIDYANARPFALPGNDAAPTDQADLILQGAQTLLEGPAGFEPGGKGSGKQKPVKLPKSKWSDDSLSSQAFGTSNHPFTTATQSDSSGDPYRRAGKLFFSDNGGSFICSASMIKPGIAVTAAHCVSDFGKKRFYTGFKYVPAYRDGVAPYGEWAAQDVFVMTSYFTGKAKCATKGVVCENDIAVLVLTAQGDFAGNRTGWFGYGWGGYSYNKNNQVLITQLGYPGALNNGQQMMRTDSQGSVDKKESNNTIIGSLQTGGSSGGPWIVNFGFQPSLSDGVKPGKEADRMVVVGTTSWGYTNQAVKEQGASPFTSDNIKILIEDACKAYPANC